MSNLIIREQTMTHLQIAEVVESRPDNVKRTIETLEEKGVIAFTQTEDVQIKGNNRKYETTIYHVNERDSYIVVAQLSPKFTAALVDEWQRLKNGNMPQTLPEALRMYANEIEQKELALAQRDEAIKTKAYISDKKTATAMATASAEKRRANKLEEELGRGTNWKAARAIPWVLEIFADSKGMWIVLGKKLKALSDELGKEVRKIESAKYQTINAYHVDVIEKMKHRLEADDNMMGKYRLSGEASA